MLRFLWACIDLSNEHPSRICNALKFSPSSTCEASVFAFCFRGDSSLLLITTTSADFLAYRKQVYSKTSPGLAPPKRLREGAVKAHSFNLCSAYLQYKDCWSGALQRCACLPSLYCLIYAFCPSIQVFAVWLPSLLGSPQTSLPLAN